jgi:type IV pilus assembly protein PilC
MASTFSISQTTPMTTAAAPAPVRSASRKRNKTPGARKLRTRELPVFTRQLAAMLSSGMPVVQTLAALHEQTSNRTMKHIITGLRTQIEAGCSLSEALRKFPDVFDDLYVSMFQAGESGGLLAETAARIANYLEAAAALRRKVLAAMMYPAIVTLVALVLTTAMVVFIVPVFSDIYADFGAVLPGPTRVLVTVSETIRSYALVILAALILGLVGLSQFKRTERGAYLWDGFKIKFPVFGELNRKVALSRFSSTFAQLIRSGVPILNAMEITAYAMGNKVLGKVILDARANVERGEPLSTALEKNPLYPRMLVHMLAAGE